MFVFLFQFLYIIAEIVLLFMAIYMFIAIISGAPFVPSRRKDIETIVELADVKKGNKVVDLGSGDGRLVIALAKNGAEVTGIEINPVLVFWSRLMLRRSKLSQNTHIIRGSFWSKDLSSYDTVVLFGITKMMKKAEKKLKKELKPGSRVISNIFKFPHWKQNKKSGNVYLYKRG